MRFAGWCKKTGSRIVSDNPITHGHPKNRTKVPTKMADDAQREGLRFLIEKHLHVLSCDRSHQLCTEGRFQMGQNDLLRSHSCGLFPFPPASRKEYILQIFFKRVNLNLLVSRAGVDRAEKSCQFNFRLSLRELRAFAEDFGSSRSVLPPLGYPYFHPSMAARLYTTFLKSLSTH